MKAIINSKNQATLEPVKNGEPKLIFDVFYNLKHPEWVKVTIAGKKTVVSMGDLFSFMFAMAKPEQQGKMIPVRIEKTDMTEFVRQHEVKLSKDMKAGESLFVRCMVKIPTLVEEQMKKEIKSCNNKGKGV